MNFTPNYAMRVWYFRTQAGYSQEALAEKSDVSQAIIAKIESGKRSLTIETAIKIAKALEISLDTLLCGQINVVI